MWYAFLTKIEMVIDIYFSGQKIKNKDYYKFLLIEVF
jgi:hypothetical protein